MRQQLAVIAAIGLLGSSSAFAQIINDHFRGTHLDDRWAWAAEDECMGWVNEGLALNPKTWYRQAAIGSAGSRYSWVAAGASRTYQFTIGDWKITTNDQVSARIFLVGNEAGVQPAAFSDYDKPNVLMADLDLKQGEFSWGLYAKTGIAKAQVDLDEYKLAGMPAGTNVQGCTFGVTLDHNTGRLWWKDATGNTFTGTNVVVPAYAFSKSANVYVGVKNDTRTTFGPDETVTISAVRIGP